MVVAIILVFRDKYFEEEELLSRLRLDEFRERFQERKIGVHGGLALAE